MNCSHIIDDMLWSYSRITTYEDCPYKFYLKYIRKIRPERRFFSDFGSFVHLILEKYYKGELAKGELVTYYLLNFKQNVCDGSPSRDIFSSYFSQGVDYLSKIDEIGSNEKILGVEKEVSFKLNDKDFVGIIDKVSEENGITITDNKSKTLKPRSKRGNLKSDQELDKYLRQLYIYSIPIKEEFGQFPDRLIFNCFRTGDKIIEPFDIAAFEKTKLWAIETIQRINEESEWNPDLDFFKCKYICDVTEQCEYYSLIK